MGRSVVYKIQLGAVAQALSVILVPDLKENDLVVTLSAGSCPEHTDITAKRAPENTEENARNYLVDITGSDDYEVGVNTPSMVVPGEWYVRVRNVKTDGVGAFTERKFTIHAKTGAAACGVPSDIGKDLCGNYVNYPVLQVQTDERDRLPAGLALSPTDPREGARR